MSGTKAWGISGSELSIIRLLAVMRVPRPDNSYHILMCRSPGLPSTWGSTEGRDEKEERRKKGPKATTRDIFLIKSINWDSRNLVEAWYEGEEIHQSSGKNIASRRPRKVWLYLRSSLSTTSVETLRDNQRCRIRACNFVRCRSFIEAAEDWSCILSPRSARTGCLPLLSSLENWVVPLPDYPALSGWACPPLEFQTEASLEWLPRNFEVSLVGLRTEVSLELSTRIFVHLEQHWPCSSPRPFAPPAMPGSPFDAYSEAFRKSWPIFGPLYRPPPAFSYGQVPVFLRHVKFEQSWKADW